MAFSCQIGMSYRGRTNGRFEEDSVRFFSSFGGSTWHRADVEFVFWVSSQYRQLIKAGKHWLLLTILITFGVLSVFAFVYHLSRRCTCGSLRRLRGWRRIRTSDVEGFIGSGDDDWVEMEAEKGIRSPRGPRSPRSQSGIRDISHLE